MADRKSYRKLERNFKTVACDFDGTLCEDAFPEIGEAKLDVIERVKEHKANGGKVILWTCRDGEYLEEAVIWCKKQGIEFDSVNEDIDEIKNADFGRDKSVKVFADEYWDDKAVNVQKLMDEPEKEEADRISGIMVFLGK